LVVVAASGADFQVLVQVFVIQNRRTALALGI
jgi:hypothetical protein